MNLTSDKEFELRKLRLLERQRHKNELGNAKKLNEIRELEAKTIKAAEDYAVAYASGAIEGVALFNMNKQVENLSKQLSIIQL